MIPLLKASTHRAAMREVETLLEMAARTGEDIVPLIEVPEVLRAELDAFCAANPGPLGNEILEILQLRDAMLDYLEVLRAA